MKSPKRIQKLPPYIFEAIDNLKEKALQEGRDIISLGVGDPDQPTPGMIIDALSAAAQQPCNHQYPPYIGTTSFRRAVAAWYKRRFDVDLDPEGEVLALIGSKEGIAHMTWGWAEEGDVVLVPDPSFPVYRISTIFADATPYALPLQEERGFLPDFKAIPPDVCRMATLLYLNYPNNPTGATADLAFFEEAVDFARKNEIILCHDLAYSEVSFDGYKPPSVLQVPGAKEVAVEFHSLSKTFNMTGWRMGMAVGSRRLLENLRLIKLNVDSGQFVAVQEAATQALLGPDQPIVEQAALYQGRRDLLVKALRDCGLEPFVPKASFYVWVKVPRGYTSMAFALHLLAECGLVVVPGIGFGEHGEGYIRFSLTVADERLKEAIRRLASLTW